MSICPIVNEVWCVAQETNSGQVDKAGRPYVEHVAQVALAVEGDDEAEAVAWLHDVLENGPAHAHRFLSSRRSSPKR